MKMLLFIGLIALIISMSLIGESFAITAIPASDSARVKAMLDQLTSNAVTAEDFETSLASYDNLYLFSLIANNWATATAVAADTDAITIVAASSTAMNTVIASSTAMNAVIASSTAMNAVAASSTAMSAVAASSTAFNLILKSDTARTAITATGTANNNLQALKTTILTTLGDTNKFTKVLNSQAQDGGSLYGMYSGNPAWNASATKGEIIVIVEKAGSYSGGVSTTTTLKHLQDTSYTVSSIATTTACDSNTLSSNQIYIGGISYAETGDAQIIASAWKAL